jgi:uridine kinase
MENRDAGTTIIAIAGGSCSGKTSLANEVARAVPCSDTIIIPMDSYYHDLSGLELEKRGEYNFDHPGSIDLEMYERNLRRLASGLGALIPVYDYVTHTRAPRETWRAVGPRTGVNSRYVIVEGLHVLYRKSSRALYDLAVFIDVDFDTCLRRRIERDVRERGRTRAGVTEQFEKTVRPMYEEFVLPRRDHADLTVDGTMPPGRSALEVIAALERS